MAKLIISKPLQSFLISIGLGLLIILLLPSIFDKYQAKEVKYLKREGKNITTFQDLNNDGYSEEIWLQGSVPNRSSILIMEHGLILNQWTFGRNFIFNEPCFVGDHDNNGLKEVYFFTYSNDSIFLHGINPFADSDSEFLLGFIDNYKLRYDTIEINIHKLEFIDHDGDGYKEFVFTISTGFARYPRRIYSYNIKKGTVLKSPESGSSILFPIAFDINNDDFKEYTFQSCAYENFDKNYPYSDNQAWLMVLDQELKFLFNPKPFGEHKTILQVTPFTHNDTCYLALLQKHAGPEDVDNALFIYDIHGNRIAERKLGGYKELEHTWLLSSDNSKRNDLFLIQGHGIAEKLNLQLETMTEAYIEGIIDGRPLMRFDLDNDGKDEFVFKGKNMQDNIITRNDFSYPVTIQATNDLIGYKYLSSILRGDQTTQLYIQFGGHSYVFDYYRNPLYPLKFVIYIGIIATIYLLILLGRKLRQIRRYEAEKNIASLQLKSIKNQVDPHFTLNIMNSIGTLFTQRDPDQANYVFGKYAKMLRGTILSSDNIATTLSEEIEYIRNYLDLESFRLGNKLRYEINIDKKVDQDYKIPKMLLYTFVENAIKHGIRHLKSAGELKINIEKKRNHYLISILDNGVGRSKAKEYSDLSTGAGLKIVDQIINLYYKLERIRIKYEIIDLFDNEKNPAGTKVIISVPK